MVIRNAVAALLLIVMGAQVPVAAHNGAAGLAVPVEHLTVDGVLDDWPATARWYPLAVQGYGVAPTGADDFSGRFSVGYSTAENALYLAAQVRDESVLRGSVQVETYTPWDAQDGIEVYVDLGHGRKEVPAVQFNMYGTRLLFVYGDKGLTPADQVAKVAVRRQTDGLAYEWRIDTSQLWQEQLQAGLSIGLDVAVCDKDADGSFSWMTWGKGVIKIRAPDRRGDLVLASTENGWIQGQVQRIDGQVMPHQPVTLSSGDSKNSFVQVETDIQGTFAVELPAGRYALDTKGGSTEKETLLVEAKASGRTEVVLKIPPPQGKKVRAGPGHRVEAGPGSWKEAWFSLGVEDGLLDATLHDLCQDHLGNLWIATETGVCRYDGHYFWSLTSEDGLARGAVWSVLEDRQGNLWFGTQGGGVSRYDGQYFTNFAIEDGLGSDIIKEIVEDRQGDLWFATWGGGISRYDGQYFTTLTAEDGLGNNAVEAVIEDHRGNLWFGLMGGGVSKYDGRSFTRYTTTAGLGHNHIYDITEDHQGNLWFATWGGGICRYDGSGFTTFTTKQGLPGDSLLVVREDSDGTMWFGGGSGQFSRLARETGAKIELVEGAPLGSTESMLEDREGNLWFAIRGGGLRQYGSKQFTSFTPKEGLAGYYVTSILPDRYGKLWFGTWDGVSCYSGGKFTSLTTMNGLGNDKINALYEDHDGNLWIGTYGGVSRYDGKHFTNFTTKDGLGHDVINAIGEDREGNLWFGGWGSGVSQFNGKEFRLFTTKDGLAGNAVDAVYRDHRGDLWFGTNQGVSRYDGQRFSNYTEKEGLVSGTIGAIAEDQHGVMWFGSESSGLSRYDGEGFTTFTIKDGLASNRVRPGAIYVDRGGTLWVGTQSGVSRYDGAAFQSLQSRDGLGCFAVTCIYQDPNGEYWFGGNGGATRFRPHRSEPPVYVSDVVAGERYGPVDHVSLPSSQGLLAVEFYGLSLKTRPGAMLYRYQLHGFDTDWHYTHEQRAEYHQLPRGQYSFEVQAIDRDLAYSANPARVHVEVRFPYERLGWLGALVLSIGVAGWQTGRVVRRGRRLRQANQALSLANKELFRVSQAKSSFLASMSHELRTPMNAILGFSELLKGNEGQNLSGQQLSNLEIISRNAGELLILIEQLLDLSRIEAGRMKVVAEQFEIREVVEESLAVVKLLVAEKAVGLWSDYEVENLHCYTDRAKVKQILVNLLSNAAKFTEAGSVGVWVQGDKGRVRLSVMDSGAGIAAEHLDTIFEEFRQVRHPRIGQGTGLGLAITRRLCRLLGGDVSATSVPGKGSTFTVTLPAEWKPADNPA